MLGDASTWGGLLPLAMAFILVLTRCGAAFLFVPILGGEAIPPRVRIAAAISIAAMLTPLAARGGLGSDSVQSGLLGLLVMSIGEFLFGMSLGLVFRLVLFAAEFSGELLGMQMGFSFSRVVDPLTRESSAVTSRIFSTIGLLLMIALDGHRMLIAAVARSLHDAPLGTVFAQVTDFPRLPLLLSAVVRLGFRMAAPVVISLFLANVALALLARAAPQLQLFALGFGVSVGIGMAILAISSWPTFSLFAHEIGKLPAYFDYAVTR